MIWAGIDDIYHSRKGGMVQETKGLKKSPPLLEATRIDQDDLETRNYVSKKNFTFRL